MSLATNTSTCKRPCIYLDKHIGCCNYYLDTGNRRPCPPGKGCTVRQEKARQSYWHRKSGRRPAWDVTKARRLREAGWSWDRVAEAVGSNAATVSGYFYYHKKHGGGL